MTHMLDFMKFSLLSMTHKHESLGQVEEDLIYSFILCYIISVGYTWNSLGLTRTEYRVVIIYASFNLWEL